jgi:peptidoglycan hydrolase CwlO-like protein
MSAVKRKIIILSILLTISLSTVAFVTVKYIHTVRSFNKFYETARQTAELIDSETADLQTQIEALEENINTLKEDLENVTAERDELAQQLSGNT